MTNNDAEIYELLLNTKVGQGVEAAKPWYMKETRRASRSLWKAELKAVEG